MTSIAKGLTKQDAADLAAWFSSLPPCFVCHGAKGRGEKQDIPALAGQQADYFARTLAAYKNGQRHNDIYSRMRLIAQQLSDAEIRELAQYYQQLK